MPEETKEVKTYITREDFESGMMKALDKFMEDCSVDGMAKLALSVGCLKYAHSLEVILFGEVAEESEEETEK